MWWINCFCWWMSCEPATIQYKSRTILCNISHGFDWHNASRGPSATAALLITDSRPYCFTVVRATSYTHGEWENWGCRNSESRNPRTVTDQHCRVHVTVIASALSPHMPKFKMIALFGASGHVGEISLSGGGFQFSFLWLQILLTLRAKTTQLILRRYII